MYAAYALPKEEGCTLSVALAKGGQQLFAGYGADYLGWLGAVLLKLIDLLQNAVFYAAGLKSCMTEEVGIGLIELN